MDHRKKSPTKTGSNSNRNDVHRKGVNRLHRQSRGDSTADDATRELTTHWLDKHPTPKLISANGRKILDRIEVKLELKKEKMKVSSEVLNEYGNMWSSSVIFVLDEMRNRSIVKGTTTTAEGFEYGVLSWMWTRCDCGDYLCCIVSL
ncbi:Chalcone synthase 5 [Camellia lanceoleosa]|uniref:Chalcone synthase 5 n=1 Tax=Camellia lanceoleosa TaxID=1840588 RepID=A0ACC0GEW0_9ERIC|nr:Chalcone synthase 5 [Camellia lanceoleosa]